MLEKSQCEKKKQQQRPSVGRQKERPRNHAVCWTRSTTNATSAHPTTTQYVCRRNQPALINAPRNTNRQGQKRQASNNTHSLTNSPNHPKSTLLFHPRAAKKTKRQKLRTGTSHRSKQDLADPFLRLERGHMRREGTHIAKHGGNSLGHAPKLGGRVPPERIGRGKPLQ